VSTCHTRTDRPRARRMGAAICCNCTTRRTLWGKGSAANWRRRFSFAANSRAISGLSGSIVSISLPYCGKKREGGADSRLPPPWLEVVDGQSAADPKDHEISLDRWRVGLAGQPHAGHRHSRHRPRYCAVHNLCDSPPSDRTVRGRVRGGAAAPPLSEGPVGRAEWLPAPMQARGPSPRELSAADRKYGDVLPVPRTAPRTPGASSRTARPCSGSVTKERWPPYRTRPRRGRGVSGRPGGPRIVRPVNMSSNWCPRSLSGPGGYVAQLPDRLVPPVVSMVTYPPASLDVARGPKKTSGAGKLYPRLPDAARRRRAVRWAAGSERSPVTRRGDPEQAGPTPPGTREGVAGFRRGPAFRGAWRGAAWLISMGRDDEYVTVVSPGTT
jgi:hypothetical protein